MSHYIVQVVKRLDALKVYVSCTLVPHRMQMVTFLVFLHLCPSDSLSLPLAKGVSVR